MIDNIFPLKLHLTILQLEEYKSWRFISWIIKNPSMRFVETKKPLKITQKIKMIIVAGFIWLVLFSFISYLLFSNFFVSLIISLLLATQPWIFIILGLFTILPYEYFNKIKTVKETNSKINSIKNLKVIGISGSYGKTSTKELLYQLIKDEFKTLRTPDSYNTIFGIAKVVKYELDKTYQVFICELGEYKIGEVKYLSNMVNPKYGLITGITKQHFERFKSIDSITKTVFELADFIADKTKIALNISSREIKNESKNYPDSIKYGNDNSNVYINNVNFGKESTNLNLIINKKLYKVKTNLFGFSAINNLCGAIAGALILEIDVKKIIDKIPNLKPFDHRYERAQQGKTTIVDNTYSSNIVGFNETIKTASTIKGTKVLITPGIVELGSAEFDAHQEIGKNLNGAFDKIILVGENNRTRALKSTITDKNVLIINDTRKEYQEILNNLIGKYDWIFLENDVTQNY